MSEKQRAQDVFKDTPMEEVLRKLCEAVGCDYEKHDFTKEGHYNEYEWTKEQRDKYAKWLEDYLYNNAKARRFLMSVPFKSKRWIRRFIDDWLLFIGWKSKRDEDGNEI